MTPSAVCKSMSNTINSDFKAAPPELSSPPVEFAPEIPIALASRVYAKAGRVHIPGAFQPAVANSIFQRLHTAVPWRLVYSDAAGEHQEIRSDQFVRMGEQAYVDLLGVAAQRGSVGFQYVYREYPLYDQFIQARGGGEPYLMQLMEFLNSAEFLTAMRKVTGDDSIEIVDANATLYQQGHFLTRHDDDIAGKNRVAAYVLNLTPVWMSDWGGILTFHSKEGHISEGYIPTFNALNIFRVPQMHAVSYVSPLAGAAGRYSIAGWLRRGVAS
jgi:SM-20-related protein